MLAPAGVYVHVQGATARRGHAADTWVGWSAYSCLDGLGAALLCGQTTAGSVLPHVEVHLEAHVLGQVDAVEVRVEDSVLRHIAAVGSLVGPLRQFWGQARQQRG